MDGTVECSGAVIAGGGSRRMGIDKRWVEVGGISLLRRAIDVVASVADDVSVVTASQTDAAEVARRLALGTGEGRLRVAVDHRGDAGPLAGIEAGLTAAAHEIVVVLAADHPFVTPAVLELLVARLTDAPDRLAVVLAADGRTQPLVAAYRRVALRRVTSLLDAGERRARALLDELDAVVLPRRVWGGSDTVGLSAMDVDTPADLARARTRVGSAREHAPARVAEPAVARSRSRTWPVTRVRGGVAGEHEDEVIGEDPLEIRVHGPGQAPVTVMTTMRTRGNDADLAVGWLFGEGLLHAAEVVEISCGDPLDLAQPEDQVTVRLSRPVDAGAISARHAAATAACGVCGRASIDELVARADVADPHDDVAPLPWSTVAQLPDRLRTEQRLYATTGGVHATGLFTRDGRLVTMREDVGRHNALDAAIGTWIRQERRTLDDLVAVLSGRIGFELVAKAAVARIPVVVAVGAPSTLAVRTADRLGITLVGFLRGSDGNVYTHPSRIDLTRPV